MIRALNTIVHVESLSRFWSVRKTSATPASPEWVERRICSTYLAFGGASYTECQNWSPGEWKCHVQTFIFVPPLTDFSNVLAMVEARPEIAVLDL